MITAGSVQLWSTTGNADNNKIPFLVAAFLPDYLKGLPCLLVCFTENISIISPFFWMLKCMMMYGVVKPCRHGQGK